MRGVRRQEAAGYVIQIVAPSGKQARIPLSSVRLLEAIIWRSPGRRT